MADHKGADVNCSAAGVVIDARESQGAAAVFGEAACAADPAREDVVDVRSNQQGATVNDESSLSRCRNEGRS